MIDYTNYDYDSLVKRITELYKDKPGLGDGYDSSTGQMLIQLLADVNDHLFYMLDRRTQETFIETAKLDTSVITHASELGYRPRRAVSANGSLLLSLVDSDNNPVQAEGDILIPKGTKITFAEETFSTIEDSSIPAGSSTTEILIKEGTVESLQINTSDPEFQATRDVTITDYNNIEEFSIEVEAADGIYTDINSSENLRKNITSLSLASPTDKVYDIRFSKDGMRIVFGDGKFGKIPTGMISIRFIRSSGVEVNVVKTGLSFEFDGYIVEDDLNITPKNSYSYTLLNVTPIRGGSDSESVREIARNAPDSVRTNNRAITAYDHEFWVLRSGIGAIVDTLAFGEQESDSLVFNMNNVIMTYITDDTLPLTPQQIQDISEYMENFKIVTTHIAFREAKYFYCVVNIRYKKVDEVPVSNASMYSELVSLMRDYFSIQRGVIGKPFQRSELIRDIQNMSITVDGTRYNPTDYIDLDIEVEHVLEDSNLYYDVYINLDSYTPSVGDVWSMDIEEQTFSVTVESGDTTDDLIDKMSTLLQNSNLVLSSALDYNGSYSLRIKSRYFDGVFSIDYGNDDVSQFSKSSKIIDISIAKSENDPYTFIPGSVYILDDSDTVVYEDDGQGNMVGMAGQSSSFGIDYVNGRLISPTLPSGTLRLRFNQSSVKNVYPGEAGVVLLSDFIEESNEYPNSRIEFL